MSELQSYKWVLLTYQISSQPSGFRVKVWRRLQEIGAIAVKNAVYILPNTPATLEDFQWLRQEIVDAGGEAIVFTADTVDRMEDQEIVRAFQETRDRDYDKILEELHGLEKVCLEGAGRSVSDDIAKLRRRLEVVMAIDFFKAPRRIEVLAVYRRCEELIQTPKPVPETISISDPSVYRKRRWVTRHGLHIDRLASAWLIWRYIDPEAQFVFVEEGTRLNEGDIPFDMFGVEFGHHGDDCTFETLRKTFGLDDLALETIARIVHDADLKDEKFSRRDTEGIEKAIRALGSQLSDDRLLEVGFHLFGGLLDVIGQEGLP
ncbi:MAG: chromate resistance protein [Candidatus Latescibacteria bacterium]|nr:chromate resistance protein [Candidatus Latescibacterota bacterium]